MEPLRPWSNGSARSAESAQMRKRCVDAVALKTFEQGSLVGSVAIGVLWPDLSGADEREQPISQGHHPSRWSRLQRGTELPRTSIGKDRGNRRRHWHHLLRGDAPSADPRHYHLRDDRAHVLGELELDVTCVFWRVQLHDAIDCA